MQTSEMAQLMLTAQLCKLWAGLDVFEAGTEFVLWLPTWRLVRETPALCCKLFARMKKTTNAFSSSNKIPHLEWCGEIARGCKCTLFGKSIHTCQQ